jgi:RNA-binding protein
MALTGKQRRHLRSLAHHLDPVVHVGHEGISPAVLAQIDAALAAHELIKVRISTDSPDGREEAAELISAGTKSEIAQVIGHVVVVFRRRTAKKKAKVALTPGGVSGQKGSKGRPPSQRAKAKAKTAKARAKKRQKLARGHQRAESRSGRGGRTHRGEAPEE